MDHGVLIVVILIVIATAVFMVLSFWHCHCESSTVSFDKCWVATNLWTKPVSLSLRSA